MNKRACLFLNGEYAEHEPQLKGAMAAGLIIGVDGGTGFLLANGIVPRVVIGDMDSLSQEHQNQLVSRGIPIFRHSPKKDETDFELALVYALEKGCDDITVFGALGWRTDHLVANLLLPIKFLDKISIRFIRKHEVLSYCRDRIEIQGAPGDILSLIPIAGMVNGVNTDGLRYPLHDETLLMGTTRGVSNEMISDSASVSISSGVLLCVHLSDRIMSNAKRRQHD